MNIGSFRIPVMSDSYVGLQKPQIPQSSIATRIIQNVGAAFGSALLATVVSDALIGKAPILANLTNAYHAGFMVSVIFMVIGVLPALFLTNKLRKHDKAPTQVQNAGIFTTGGDSDSSHRANSLRSFSALLETPPEYMMRKEVFPVLRFQMAVPGSFPCHIP